MRWLKRSLIFSWLFLTLALAGWWLYFGLQHVVDVKYRQMLISEGLVWMVLLVAGAVGLIALVNKEEKQQKRIRQFFAAFSHDVKTAIASLRLQAESLKEEESNANQPVLDRLIADTVRLELQLENSLFMSTAEDQKLFLEPMRVSDLIRSLQFHWPRIKIHLNSDAVVYGDEKALLNVFNNLIQNALVHGGASEITVEAARLENSRIRIEVRNNGRGFLGSIEKVGELFYRPTSKSGSGVGLFIVKNLVQKMQGQTKIEANDKNFSVVFELQGAGA